MGIVHIVMFEFKPGTSPETVKDVCDRMLALKEQCILPTTNKPYIKTSVGGRDNSPEGMQHGLTHAFVVEFANEEDRNHYVDKDPAHLDFVKSIGGVIATAQVIDFAPGVF
ncbi:MAG: hypothetical protein M1837_000333 [Sclerophora amabilis]|nr:MAG: hypothetical protein M1837_000333 [Sclerophora amabilis]